MGYEPHLIANYRTGIQEDLQPWLIPDEAQAELLDGYIHHGVIHKRDGYNFLANGQRGSAPYCESRIVRRITDAATSRTNNGSALADFTLANIPVRRGTVTISDGVENHTDNGLGAFPTASDGAINYTTGVISDFTFNASSGNAVTATYDYHPGKPVMMIANFVTSNNVKEMIVADEEFLNKYNLTTNRLDDITFSAFTGSNSDFFTWTMYPTVIDTPRLMFTNNVDQIQYYDGTNVNEFYPLIASETGTQETSNGTNSPGPYTRTLANAPVAPGSLSISDGTQVVTDDGAGNLQGNGTGTINYVTGFVSVTFNAVVVVGVGNITWDFEYGTDYVISASKIANFKDRMVLLRTTELGGTIHPQRIRISGTGQGGDDFRTIRLNGATSLTLSPGAGVIDIPTGQWIQGAEFNRDDLIIYTEDETWILKFTGSDVVPFSLDKIDSTRGNRAPFAPISYLNMTKAYSPLAITITDGYQVKRYDNRIPDYTYERIDQNNFDLCFSGSVDDDHNHYLIHPSPGETKSDRILINNYDEDNFSIFRIPLSCMGNFFESFDITWEYLTEENGFPDWEAFGNTYATWNSIGYSKESAITVGGGHFGEIWRLNSIDGEDNPLRIYGITVDSTGPLNITVVSDWHNYVEGDSVFFDGITGDTTVTSAAYGSGDGTVGPYLYTSPNKRIDPSSVTIVADPAGSPQTLTDDGSGLLTGDGSGTIDYQTGAISATFDTLVTSGDDIEITYTYEYELNSKQGLVTSVVGNTSFTVQFESSNPINIATYTSGGIVSRIIPFEFVTKNFNPYAQAGMKVRCGWVYFYIDTADTNATDPQYNELPTKVQIEIYTNDRYPGYPTQVTEVDIPVVSNPSDFNERGSLKVWRKVFINQTAGFIQFKVKNTQQATRIRIHAIQPGFKPGGRMI